MNWAVFEDLSVAFIYIYREKGRILAWLEFWCFSLWVKEIVNIWGGGCVGRYGDVGVVGQPKRDGK